jgi:hypothetical protein
MTGKTCGHVIFMRRETPANQHERITCYGAGTRVEVHRSRYELERILNKHGADEVLFVEADLSASIQFAMRGRYVQLALPLPDPGHTRFTHTPSGRPRAVAAQERAYEQAMREHWRSLVVAVRGKLQSVESGISTFEHEFDKFLVPHRAEKKKRSRNPPRAVNWILGGSHSLAIALVAASLVPASAVGAFALPTNVVGHLAAPFRSSVRDDVNADNGSNRLTLALGAGAQSKGGNSSGDTGRLSLTGGSDLVGDAEGQVRQPTKPKSPQTEPVGAAGPASAPSLASVNTAPLSSGGGADQNTGTPSVPSSDGSDEAISADLGPGNGNGTGTGNPPGQANNPNNDPPGQSNDPHTPPGQANNPNNDPPGQSNDPQTPPGQADNPKNDSPGQANNPSNNPGGQGKKGPSGGQ